jgi:ribosomal protein L37AE/L43A
MPGKVPKCPICEKNMEKIEYGLYKCRECGGTYIPSDVPGTFTPCSVIGIH